MSSINAVIYGESGAGKSFVADTAPGPRLILDAEGGSEFTPSWPKVMWNPNSYAPPGMQGCEPGQEQLTETTRVIVRDWQTLTRVYQWLDSGNHGFQSVVMDSLTEIQKRCKDKITTTGGMQTQDWGQLLNDMEILVRQFRDLKHHPVRPLRAVIVLALIGEKDGRYRPLVQGGLMKTLGGYYDVVGYLYTEQDATGQICRRMLIQPMGQYLAKDRTHVLTKTLGPVIPIKDADSGGNGYDLNDLINIIASRSAHHTITTEGIHTT